MPDLRSRLIRLAYENPSMRGSLLPLLRSAGGDVPIPGLDDNLTPEQVDLVVRETDNPDKRLMKAVVESMVGKPLQQWIGTLHSVLKQMERWEHVSSAINRRREQGKIRMRYDRAYPWLHKMEYSTLAEVVRDAYDARERLDRKV